MVIKGKSEGISRLIGAIFILISLFGAQVIDVIIINDLVFNLLIMLIGLTLLVSILSKLEISFFKKYEFHIFITLLIVILELSFLPSYMPLSSSYFLVICWHFCLSIYKKKKIIFSICGSLFIALRIFLVLGSGNNIFLIPIVLTTIGMLLILIAEKVLKKKGLLNYI